MHIYTKLLVPPPTLLWEIFQKAKNKPYFLRKNKQKKCQKSLDKVHKTVKKWYASFFPQATKNYGGAGFFPFVGAFPRINLFAIYIFDKLAKSSQLKTCPFIIIGALALTQGL